ncbi:MAG: efflux RND transporter permease subunit [Methylococcaceae bacterium]|nr:efflux RND transporter permease subunit [Methylococcaceae bacterium]
MQSVIQFSLQQKIFFNLVFIVLMLGGTYATFAITTDRYPHVNFGEVIITTYFPGASPSEVETLVTRELEEALETVKSVEWMKSTSFRERSRIRLKFIDDSDYVAGFSEVRLKILNRLDQLPAETDPPEFIHLETEDYVPVIVVNLAGDVGNRSLALMADELKSSLREIPGVEHIKVFGEYEREFHVLLDPKKLNGLGLTFEDVALALQQSNVSIPAGDYKNESGEFTVRVDEKFHNRDQVVSTIIRTDSDGSFVRVGDVISRAELSYKDPRAMTSVNGRDALAMQIIKAPTGNALDIKSAVEQAVAAFQPVAERQGVELLLSQDSTVYIHDGLSTLGSNLVAGVILVTLIIWYFMGLRNAGLIAIGIPFSFLLSLILMYATGTSLNELSLFSFVLVSGMIVDDAIVVTENIYRHAEKGEPLQQAIIKGATEVGLPVISATLTTIAAFMPMLIMTGVTGEFFEIIPATVSFALLASLAECLLILPIHYLDFGPRPGRTQTERFRGSVDRVLTLLQNLAYRGVNFTLQHRIAALSLILVLFILCVAILGISISGAAPLIRIKFFPDDYTLYYVDVEGRSSTPIEEVDRHVKKIARYVIDDGPGKAITAAGIAGFYVNEDYEQIFGNHYGSVTVTLPAKEDQTFDSPIEHLAAMARRLKQEFQTDGFELRLHPQKDGPPQGKDLNVRIQGSNLESIEKLADELLRFLKDNSEFASYLQDLQDDRGKPKRNVRFEVRHERASEYGLTPARVASLAASVLDGRIIGKYRLSDEEIDLRLRVDPGYAEQPEDALHIPLVEHASGPVRLGDLTNFRTFMESGELNRYESQRAITLQANLDPTAPTSIPVILQTIQQHYDSIRHDYPGASLSFGGDHEETQRSYRSLGYAFVLGFLLIYLILASQFQSYVQPLIIMTAIGFALIGVVIGKLLSQTIFTLNSFIAVVGVAGVVVNDALVLVDFMNKLHAEGMSRADAIHLGVKLRLRPILLTSLTTTLALLPMALGFPSYSLIWGSMASTFVTGLATATTLTIFIVPVLWDIFQSAQGHRKSAACEK